MYTYEIYQTGNRYGFTVLDGETEIVRQDFKPYAEGFLPMNESEAIQAALTVIAEMENRPPAAIDLTPLKQTAVAKTKAWVSRTLEVPIEYHGKFYSVTMEKQNLLSAQLGMYMMNAQAGIPFQLTWNASGEPCVPWEFEELLMLSNIIAGHVSAIVKKQQLAEVAITAAESEGEIDEILSEFT